VDEPVCRLPVALSNPLPLTKYNVQQRIYSGTLVNRAWFAVDSSMLERGCDTRMLSDRLKLPCLHSIFEKKRAQLRKKKRNWQTILTVFINMVLDIIFLKQVYIKSIFLTCYDLFCFNHGFGLYVTSPSQNTTPDNRELPVHTKRIQHFYIRSSYTLLVLLTDWH
jgi:hypothetical protein